MSAPARAANPWAMPDGRLLLPAGAPREQWLAERQAGIGSSDIAQLMGVAEGGSEYELWLDKTGRAGEDTQTEAMRRGVWLEPHVVDYFTGQTSVMTRRCGLVANRNDPRLRTTPDRLTADGGCLEVKTIGNFAKVRAEWRGGGIARHAYVQGMWQLMATGRSHVWFAAYTIDQEPQIRGPVERDEALIARLLNRAMQWWHKHVELDQPPPVDLATITDEEIVLRWPSAEEGSVAEAEWPAHVRALLAERAELKAQTKAATDRAKEIDAALKVMTGSSEALRIGERVVLTLKPQANNPSVDPALAVDHPDIYAHYIKRGSSRRIHVCKGWDLA